MIACKLVNYLRYSLQLISSYIYIAFTILRLHVVSNPLRSRSFTKKSAWKNVCLIGIVSFLLTSLAPFAFHIIRIENQPEEFFYCDVNYEYKFYYFAAISFYICLTIFIPSVIIFVCNMQIICKILENKAFRKDLLKPKRTIVEKTIVENTNKIKEFKIPELRIELVKTLDWNENISKISGKNLGSNFLRVDEASTHKMKTNSQISINNEQITAKTNFLGTNPTSTIPMKSKSLDSINSNRKLVFNQIKNNLDIQVQTSCRSSNLNVNKIQKNPKKSTMRNSKLNSKPIKNFEFKIRRNNTLPGLLARETSNYNSLTLTLLLISLSFVIINFPNSCFWLYCFYQQEFHSGENDFLNPDLIRIVQILQILHIMNYGTKFFIFIGTGKGTFFRNMSIKRTFENISKNFNFLILTNLNLLNLNNFRLNKIKA